MHLLKTKQKPNQKIIERENENYEIIKEIDGRIRSSVHGHVINFKS